MALQIAASADSPTTLRQVGEFGTQLETMASSEMRLLEGNLKGMMTNLDGTAAGDIPTGLMQLRGQLDELNPEMVMADLKPKGLTKFFRKAPVIGDVLAKVAMKYQSVNTTIDGIVGGLLGGADKLLQDNITLEQLYARAKQRQAEIRAAAYQGEVILAELERRKGLAADQGEQMKLAAVCARVAKRIESLRVQDTVHEQFFASISLTTENNDALRSTVIETANTARALLTIGLSIQMALHNQKRVAEATQGAQAMMGDMLKANATAVRTQGAEIRAMANSTVISMDDVQKAHMELMAALDEAEQARTAGYEAARINAGKMKAMAEEMEKRTAAVEGAKQAAGLLPQGI
jgi:uncharacterized protein YaaN involved in tellurite resistance